MNRSPDLQMDPSEFSDEKMREVLKRQRAAHLADGPPSAELRIDRIDRAIGLVVDHADEMVEALVTDFGHRSREESLLSNVSGSIEPRLVVQAQADDPVGVVTQHPVGIVVGLQILDRR